MDKNMNINKEASASATKAPVNSLGKADVICVDPTTKMTEVLSLMKDHTIGDVVVVDDTNGSKKPIGMITDRDVALKCLGKPNFESMTVNDCMTPGEVVTCREDADVFEMVRVMKECGIGRLPLVNEEGGLTKIVTARNLFQCLTEGLLDLVGISRAQKTQETETAPFKH